jgi:hypothetical protein
MDAQDGNLPRRLPSGNKISSAKYSTKRPRPLLSLQTLKIIDIFQVIAFINTAIPKKIGRR